MIYRTYPCKECKKHYTSINGVTHYKPILESTFPEIDFSEFKSYISTKSKIECRCTKHGVFYSSIDSLLSSRIGCRKCSYEYRANNRRLSIKDLENRHKGKGFVYISIVDDVVTYICPKHGVQTQLVSNHASGKGCAKCGLASGKRIRLTNTIIKHLDTIHNSKYKYIDILHITVGKNPILIYECPIHGIIRQDYQNHKKGKACPLCNTGFRNRGDTVPTYVYVIYFRELKLWKLGVTKFKLKKRFSSEPTNYITLLLHKCVNGNEAYDIESKGSGALSHIKYTGPKVLVSGNTELYTEDITKTVTEIISNYSTK